MIRLMVAPVAILIVLGAIPLALAGCARTSPSAPSPLPNAPAAPGSFRLRLTVAPNPPRSLDLTNFTIAAQDGAGVPLVGASVTVELTMPSMAMPKNEVVCVPAKPGEYSGKGRFTMPGDWRAHVTARRGALRGEQTFPIAVK